MSEAQRNLGIAPARIKRSLSFSDETEDHKNGKEQGSESANTSSEEFMSIDTMSSAIDHPVIESSHRYWLGSAPDASSSDAEIGESTTTTVENPTDEIIEVPAARTVCAYCKSPVHRSTCCPHLPCRHCDKMGHVGTKCPKKVEETNQKKEEARRRYREKIAAARSKVFHEGATCSNCRNPNHQRTTCPDLPCRHCDTMGHIGKHCPHRKDMLVQATRDSKRRYKERIAISGRGGNNGKPSESPELAAAGLRSASLLCSHCREPNHRRPACPELPCSHCNKVGHVVTFCPLKAEDIRQRMREAQSRHKERRDTVAGVPPSTALCTQCKQQGHRKPACPSLPCRHCGKMGHVGDGNNCPFRAELIVQRLRESSQRYRNKKRTKITFTQEREKISSGIGRPILLVEEEARPESD